MIKDAEIVLAELTTKNANVFYELGLSHAIGKPVVLISETMNDVPFDLQQLRVLLYNKDNPTWGQKLCSEITASLKETLENSDETIPPIFKIPVRTLVPEQNILEVKLSEIEQIMRRIEYSLIQPHRPISREDAVSIGHLTELARIDLIISTTGGRSITVGDWFDKWEKKGLPHNLLNEIMANYFITEKETPEVGRPEVINTKTS